MSLQGFLFGGGGVLVSLGKLLLSYKLMIDFWPSQLYFASGLSFKVWSSFQNGWQSHWNSPLYWLEMVQGMASEYCSVETGR